VLILNRKVGEVVVIGEGENRVEVEVVEIRGDKVRLGIVANTGIPVDRLEVRLAKERSHAVK
jgi:carbon storage regulator CsrA